MKWPVRLGVRTPGFHPGNRGSIPLRATKKRKILWQIINQLSKELEVAKLKNKETDISIKLPELL